MKQIDARGLSCPQPVVLVQKAINEGSDKIEVLLNAEVSKENVIRLLSRHKMSYEIKNVNDDIIVTASK